MIQVIFQDWKYDGWFPQKKFMMLYIKNMIQEELEKLGPTSDEHVDWEKIPER